MALIVVWYVACQSGLVPPIWLPTPASTVAAFGQLLAGGEYLPDILASIDRLIVGYGLSVVLGISIGTAVGVWRPAARFVEPLVGFLSGITGLAWIPLAILWFGLGDPTVYFIIWNSVFFLVLYNTVVGIRGVSSVYEAGLLTLGASRLEIIRDVLIPGALPNIVTGLRLGMGFGWRALIAAEIFASSTGLGFMIFNASSYFRTNVIIVGLATIGIIWLVTDRVVFVRLERWTTRRWGLVTEA